MRFIVFSANPFVPIIVFYMTYEIHPTYPVALFFFINAKKNCLHPIPRLLNKILHEYFFGFRNE